MKKTFIYIERVRFYHYPFIKYWISKGCSIYVFDFKYVGNKTKWLEKLINKGFISSTSNYSCENHVLALDSIEKVFARDLGNSRLKNAMVKMYNDVNIEMAYKKILVRQISDFFAVQRFMLNNNEAVSNDVKNILIPDKYNNILNILVKSGVTTKTVPNCTTPWWAYVESYASELVNRISRLMLFFTVNIALVFAIMLKTRTSAHKKPIKHFKYAVLIIYQPLQFRFNKSRNFDFLLDGNSIKKSNTIFISNSNLDKNLRKKLISEGYNIIDSGIASCIKLTEFNLTLPEGLRLIKKFVLYGMNNMFSVFFERDYAIFYSTVLLVEYLRWNIVINNVAVSNFISFNDDSINHIGRNILLSQHSCKTWYYEHSASMEYIRALKEHEIEKHKHWLWSFLLYDYYIGWNRMVINHQKQHLQKIKEYFNIGCIWSTLILDSPVKTLEQYLQKQNVQKKIDKKYKVISFFDTSFVDGINSNYPLKDGVKYYNDILKLLEDMDGVFVIAKEKKSELVYAVKKTYIYSLFNKEYSDVLKKMRNHPRVYLSGVDGDQSDIINVSDLVVTYAYSSCTVEALGARKRAIFYDPLGKLYNYYYSAIPDLVAHNYNELKTLVHKLVYEFSDADYHSYLDNYVAGKIEDYLDGKALFRFRELLVGNADKYTPKKA